MPFRFAEKFFADYVAADNNNGRGEQAGKSAGGLGFGNVFHAYCLF